MAKEHPTDSAPFHNPFAQLAAKRSDLPPGATPTTSPASSSSPSALSRAVVRYERKGHGGKEMTRLERLGLSPKERERWLKDLKQALGCGGVVEGDTLLLQGDQRERLRSWLERRGVGKVTVS